MSVREEGSPLLVSFDDRQSQDLEHEDVELELVSLLQGTGGAPQSPGVQEVGIFDIRGREGQDVVKVPTKHWQHVKENSVHSFKKAISSNNAADGLETRSVSPAGHHDDGSSSSSVITSGTTKHEAATPPLWAYFLLLSAVVSLSLIGPLLVLQGNATPSMKIVWRMTGTCLILLPAACHELYSQGLPRLNYQQWGTFLLSTICYDATTLAFVISLDYTAVGNAVVLANSQALILLVGKMVVLGESVSAWEGLGAIGAFGGAVLCSKDAVSTRQASNAFRGDLLAIISAFTAVGYLVFAKAARRHLPMYTFMFLTMGLGAFLVWMFQLTILKEQATFDMDYNHGVWGFLRPVADRLPLELMTVFICNICGTMG
jgi:drug/metabolite transporter (DMT)-like permease